MTKSLAPLILSFDGVEPKFASPPIFCGEGSSLLGKITLGARASIGRDAVIRADGHFVRIGADFFLGEAATVHIAHDVYPTIVGDRVTVGRNAVVHACTVGDGCVIEDDVVILDGSVVEDDVVIVTGSTVFPRSTLQRGHLYAGSPAKLVRALDAGEQEEHAERLRGVAPSAAKTSGVNRGRLADNAFVALTAHLSGEVICAENSSVFFGCRLTAETGAIEIGPNTNVQDNSIIVSTRNGVVIGRDTTIGHNVRMSDCRIGDRSLIGIGSVLAEASVVEDDVLFAAGARTTPGQRLTSGSVWGGSPARIIGDLDERKRKLFTSTITHYCAYAQAYKRAQDALA